MKGPDDPLRDLVAQWIAKANIDYRTAVRLSADEDPHSIAQLLDLVETAEPSLDDATVLTAFGVQIRYPGDFAEVLPGEEKTVLGVAARARSAVFAALGFGAAE